MASECIYIIYSVLYFIFVKHKPIICDQLYNKIFSFTKDYFSMAVNLNLASVWHSNELLLEPDGAAVALQVKVFGEFLKCTCTLWCIQNPACYEQA